MNTNIILSCNTEGGSITVFENEGVFFFQINEMELIKFTDELDIDNKDLTTISDGFLSFNDVMQNLLSKYRIFTFYPTFVQSKYIGKLQSMLVDFVDEFIQNEWLNILFKDGGYRRKFIHLNIEKIKDCFLTVLPKIDIMNDNYLKTYPYFISFFQENELNIKNFVVGTNMIYGWMPTILDLNLNKEKELLNIFNRIKINDDLNLIDFLILKNSINNSVVGMSKLLHFANPQKYPIWDSRIYKFITETNHATNIDKIMAYVVYMQMINEVVENKDFKEIHNHVCHKLSQDITAIRCVELLMFYSNKFS